MTNQTQTDPEERLAALMRADAVKVRAKYSKTYSASTTPHPAKPCAYCGTFMGSFADKPICLPCRRSPAHLADLKARRAREAKEDELSARRRHLARSIWDGHV